MKVLPIDQRNYLLLEAECINQRLFLFFNGVLVSAIYGRFLEGELLLLILSLDRCQRFSCIHRSWHIPVETDCVGAVLPV